MYIIYVYSSKAIDIAICDTVIYASLFDKSSNKSVIISNQSILHISKTDDVGVGDSVTKWPIVEEDLDGEIFLASGADGTLYVMQNE